MKNGFHTSVIKAICSEYDLPAPEFEVLAIPGRKFRADIYFAQAKVAVEVEGGVWTNGRHTRGSGFLRDAEKYNLYVQNGIRLLRYTPQQITKRETWEQIKAVINQ